MRSLLLLFSLLLAACGTAEEVADDVADTTVDAAETTVDVADDVVDATADVAVAGADVVADLATGAYDEARRVLGAGEVSDDARVAVAQIDAPADTTSDVRGTVTFVETANGVRVRYELAGLGSSEPHGFHVHAVASCASGDFDDDGYAEAGGAAGEHLNPGDDPHGAPGDPQSQKHAGDLGNVMPDASGEASGAKTVAALSFEGDRSVVGRAVIVHAKPDTFNDAGAMAGGRVGCGVVSLAQRG